MTNFAVVWTTLVIDDKLSNFFFPSSKASYQLHFRIVSSHFASQTTRIKREISVERELTFSFSLCRRRCPRFSFLFAGHFCCSCNLPSEFIPPKHPQNNCKQQQQQGFSREMFFYAVIKICFLVRFIIRRMKAWVYRGKKKRSALTNQKARSISVML